MRALILLPLLLLGSLAPSWAGDVKEKDKGKAVYAKDFSQDAPGPAASSLPELLYWTGDPAGSWGGTEVVAPSAPLSTATDTPKAALLVRTSAGQPKGAAPSIVVQTPGFGAEKKGSGTFLLRFAIPVDGPYRADFFFGGNWTEPNAAILVLENGALSLMQKDEEYRPLRIGDYVPNQWVELKLVFDFEKKTYAVLLNGKAAANGIPWNSADLAAIGSLTLAVGFGTGTNLPSGAPAAPVFYLHRIEITQE